jgi:hypothetical protein
LAESDYLDLLEDALLVGEFVEDEVALPVGAFTQESNFMVVLYLHSNYNISNDILASI